VRVGILLTFLIVVGLWAFEHTRPGKQSKLAAYDFLQQRLIANSTEGRIPVALVDISDLEVEQLNIDGQIYRATPRDKLFNLVNAIAEQEPIAIGIDIDFSPNEQGYLTPHDPKFFQDCLDTREKMGIPIFLGIRRSQIYASERWLGVADYKPLAASIFIPDTGGTKLWRWIKPGDNSEEVPTMSALLAASFQHPQENLPEPLHWAIEQFSERELGPNYYVSEFLIDYSPLDVIENTRLQTTEPAGIKAQGHLLKNKVVLIGDGTLGKATDPFNVPVRDQPLPGVYLHACATYTLYKSALYELTTKGRWAIDLLLSFIILAVITGIRLYYRDQPTIDVNTHWLQGFLTILVLVAAFLVGVMFVHFTRVLWDDFIFVFAGLLLHPKVEGWAGGFWKFLKNDVRPIFTRRIFKSGSEGQQ
jgi:CHASE2 domain-containing sensor protein